MPPAGSGGEPSRDRRDGGRGAGRQQRGGSPGRGQPSRGAGGRRGGARDTGQRIDAPGGAKEPIGLDRASRRSDAPPRAAHRGGAPPRPPLPTDEQPVLPRGVRREIERVLGAGRRADEVALALSIGSAAIEEDRADVAVEVLAWAKYEAPRVAAVREAYGVALYLAERFAEALTELQAYRRLTGRTDQNHLVADCLRALGRDLDLVADAARGLLEDDDAPADRRAEAAIVWAAALADTGELAGGRAVLRRFLERPRTGDDEYDLRARWLAADLAGRAGERDEQRRQLSSIVAVDPDFLDAREQLEALRDV